VSPRKPWGRGVWVRDSHWLRLYYRALGWSGCVNWSHNLTWRHA
jgi:hypothetical protein